MKLTEDDLYRTSTQYQHWSFTPAQLAAQRLKTNIQATERVKANVARHRAQRAAKLVDSSATASESEANGTNTGANTPVPTVDKEVDCLTVAEEMKLVDTFCEKALELGAFCKFPTEVTATGIQFLRRFYLYNSPMTYECQNISPTAMFIANKTEGLHYTCEMYASRLSKATTEQILAPEYLIVQALRFNFEIRHPYRGLKGGHMEMMEMAGGHYTPLPNDTRTSKEVQTEMLQLPRKTGGSANKMTVSELEKRITEAYGFASHMLKNVAPLTDAYFLYTPSQIWLSAHHLADSPLTTFYLEAKLPSTPSFPSPSNPMHTKLQATLLACADLLSSHRAFKSFTSSKADAADKEAREKKEQAELAALRKKLRQCRDPDKIDLVKLNQAQKRDAVADGGLEENKAKRRKLDREKAQKEADEFWGPELASNGNAGPAKGV